MANRKVGQWLNMLACGLILLKTADADVGITYVENAVAKGAVCLDGSPPAYNWDKGFGSGINNWLVHLQGGGWCQNVTSCLLRKNTDLGSSKQMQKQLIFPGILSNQQKLNPDFYNWNRIVVRYCDGASFTGDVEEVNPGSAKNLPKSCTTKLSPGLIPNVLVPRVADPYSLWSDCKLNITSCSTDQLKIIEESNQGSILTKALKMGEEATKETVLESARAAAFKESQSLEGSSCIKIEGYDFNQGVNYSELLRSMVSTGFQASNLGDAIQVVNQMLDWRLSDESPTEDCGEEEKDPVYRESVWCKVFLGFTSNLISSGVRDTVRYLVQHHMVDVVVTTAGGIEEDLIKCLAPTYKGEFSLPGAQLRSKGLNRIGNLLVPNDNYCKFEDWIIPIFDQMLEEQTAKKLLWTPSKVIARLGKEINNGSSYLYWAYKNNIPVFCPSLTDGSLGDMLYFHSFRNPGLVIDIVQDIRAMNGEAVNASPRKTGMIILGGGLPKHHICNANMMRNGADYAVFINTAQEYDGSDSGANPDEAVSWGKIRGSAKTVKVHCDATIAFPLLVAETFAARGNRSAEMKP
ncbi:hypothetical protein Vadar_009507 [Vaccinium darrowii]|uniref:Uncharacterized protein n=1 Tax=Vaccinium darrowii TaxID=229202 RepID=A0ACB7WZR6_9ERIC|nr:hypothetical protein Vadar_009507 [Vaccinium darrowii]